MCDDLSSTCFRVALSLKKKLVEIALVDDLADWESQYGESYSSTDYPAITSPEPALLAGIILGMLLICVRRPWARAERHLNARSSARMGYHPQLVLRGIQCLNLGANLANLLLVLSAAVLSAAVIVVERRHAGEAATAPPCRIACCHGNRGMRRLTVLEYEYEDRCAEQECRLPISESQPLKSVKNLPNEDTVVGNSRTTLGYWVAWSIAIA